MPQLTRISASLAVVLVAYWAYALLAVPWIEPPPPPPPPPPVPGDPGPKLPPTVVEQQLEEIKPLFRPDDWERASAKTKVLEGDSVKLLFQKYDNTLGGGKVELTPCTIVFLSDAPAESQAQHIRESIVLQAPKALLQFDRDLNFTQLREANLLGGQLLGEIVIRSDWKDPGPEDDLLIVTKNLTINKQRIGTPERVRFSWGPHFGSGQGMEIKLLPGKSAAGGMDIGGIASFELHHIERLHLELGPQGEKLLGVKPGVKGGQQAAASALPPAKTPVEIGCSGPFRFDVAHRVATFHDNVRVMKANPAGEPDQIACDLLNLWFVERPKGAKTADAAGSLDLTPDRFEALGNPVVVTAPSNKATAQAKRIEYSLSTKLITLDGDQTVFLQQGPNQIYARSLSYQQAEEEGRLGLVVAQGPGWFHGQSPERPDQQLEAAWRDQMRLQPRGQYQEISLTGDVELKSPGIGQLQAKKVCFLFSETPSPTDSHKSDLQPQELTASEEVCFGSSQVSGKVDELQVSFEQGARGQGPGVRGQGPGGGNPNLVATAAAQYGAMGRLPPIEPSAATAAGGSFAPAAQPLQQASYQPSSSQPNASEVQRLPADAQQHFEVTGRRLRARVLRGGDLTALTDLTIEDNVELRETQTAQPGTLPMRLRGDRLVVSNADRPEAVATVTGQPACFEGDGLGLRGATIKVNAGTSHLTVDGAGAMDITTSNDLEGKPLPNPCKLTVVWQRSMDFDGRTAHFEQSVVASTPGMFSKDEITQFRLETAAMDVRMQTPIRFSELKGQQRPQVEGIQCKGGVAMDRRTYDLRQQLLSHDQMQVEDLGINAVGGGLIGGRGWINSVRHSSTDLMPGLQAASNGAAADANQLRCLHVTFQKSLSGNVRFQQVAFRDHVVVSFAPVDSWDAMLTSDDPSRLGPKGMVSTCDELFVKQMPLPDGSGRALELYALGNARAEGAEYTALASRITYAQAKEVLVLEGDGRIPAELLQQKQAGAAAKRVRAQKIQYLLKTKDIDVVGAQMIEAPLPGGRK